MDAWCSQQSRGCSPLDAELGELGGGLNTAMGEDWRAWREPVLLGLLALGASRLGVVSPGIASSGCCLFGEWGKRSTLAISASLPACEPSWTAAAAET